MKIGILNAPDSGQKYEFSAWRVGGRIPCPPDRTENLKLLNAKCGVLPSLFHRKQKTYAENYVFAAREGYYDDTESSASFNTLIKNYVDSVGSLEIGATFTVYGNEGAYFLYYLGKGDLRSRVEAREAIISDKFYDLYASLAKENKVEYNSKEGARSADLYVK